MVHYPAIFEPADEGGFVVTFPDFGWGVTQGDTVDEALAMAVDLLLTLTAHCISAGSEIPKPSRLRRRNVREVVLRSPLYEG